MNKFMKAAISEAYKGIKKGEGGPFGSVIVKDGRIVARGHNQVLLKGDPTCHGEVQTIRRAAKKLGTHDLSGCEIYTTGEPCPMCLGAIMWANIERVYYGCNIEDTEVIGFRDKKFYNESEEEHAAFVTECDREECLKLYSDYMSMNHENY